MNEGTVCMSERYFYPMFIKQLPNKQGYTGTFIDLNIEITGKNLEELIDNSHEALDKCFDDGLTPKIKSSDPTTLTPPNGQGMIIVEFDRIAYKEKHDKKTITKSVTMPAWMANIAKERRIDCSKLLQRALIAEFTSKGNKSHENIK